MKRLFAAMLLLLPMTTFAADSKGDVFTDPKEAGPDFEIQGEYVGELQDGTKLGAQVIALGDGKFDVVGYRGGLPGDGWMRGDEMKHGKGERVGDAAVAKIESEDDGVTAEIKDGTLTVMKDGNKAAELKKVARKSPTLGAKAPKDATVLFDGSNADNFTNGKIVEADGEKVLAASNPESKKLLGDHSMHIEFRTPFMPKARGQGRGNSGVYLQGRYECQVLDSFGLEGENNECGGIYTVAKPIVNMCLPPLSWQTYDIDFKAARYNDKGEKVENARATIKHNGVLIHDNIELKPTPGHHPEGPGPDHLYLQDHGNPVVFRNIWVVDKK
jgi:hypothetical protein